MLDQFFSSLSFVDIFNFCVFIVFSVCYVYQIFYVFVTLTKKPPQRTAKKNHRYAVIVAARNENAVIGDLIHSIRVQNYPQELIDIFVVADNCTDNTAAVAQEAGAIVFPRFNTEQIGKGYALDYGFSCIRQHYSENEYEAYFVFDADNVLDVNYFREMNKTFDSGAVASTSYRNSKNYGSNWITAGYAVWFMREAKYLSQARLTLGTSCAVSGTGFFISAKIIDEMGGWKYHMLTEDIEFSTASIIQGRRISYTPTAMLYDEQPLTFRDSWNQRFRWAKGFYQVFFGYGGKLVKGIFTNPKGSRFGAGHYRRHVDRRDDHLVAFLYLLLPVQFHVVHVHVRCAYHLYRVGQHPCTGAQEDLLHVHVPAVHDHLHSHRIGCPGEEGFLEADPAQHLGGRSGVRAGKRQGRRQDLGNFPAHIECQEGPDGFGHCLGAPDAIQPGCPRRCPPIGAIAVFAEDCAGFPMLLLYARMNVSARTSFAPEARRMFAAVNSVAPVVSTSSTRMMRGGTA